MRPLALLCCLTAPLWAASPSAADWIVSANDAKYARVDGRDTYPAGTGPDTLTLLDAAQWPPVVRSTTPIEHAIFGPPQAVAVTPDGTLAIVSAPNRYDRAAGQPIFDTFLQVVDLTAAASPRLLPRIPLRFHPQGVTINRAGTLALAATVGGTVAVVAIRGSTLRLVAEVPVCSGRLSGITFTTDGTAALVCRRDQQGIAVLAVDGDQVRPTGALVTSGIAPYSIDTSSDGHWAVASNVGIGGLGSAGQTHGDADSFTLIDVSAQPFRAVQHVTVPAAPEGIAISPDGQWVAVQSMAGSNIPAGIAGHRDRGIVSLFRIAGDTAQFVNALPGGVAAQGILFTRDSRHVLVQFNVEKQLALFDVTHGRLRDTGQRIPLSGGPASIRSQPR